MHIRLLFIYFFTIFLFQRVMIMLRYYLLPPLSNYIYIFNKLSIKIITQFEKFVLHFFLHWFHSLCRKKSNRIYPFNNNFVLVTTFLQDLKKHTHPLSKSLFFPIGLGKSWCFSPFLWLLPVRNWGGLVMIWVLGINWKRKFVKRMKLKRYKREREWWWGKEEEWWEHYVHAH